MKVPENGDDDLDAFLQGRDALSQRLKALAQPEPPETVSAAIHARVERDLLSEKRLPLAANDSIGSASAGNRPRSRRIFGSMALAAGLLLAVGVSVQWRQDSRLAPAVVAQSAAPAAAGTPADMAANAVASTAANTATAVAPAAAAASTAARAPREAAPPTLLAQADVASSPSSTVVRSAPAPAPAPPPPLAAGDEKADQWLKLIDGLLTNGMRRDALEEWREFRRLYPDYPVAQAFNARIDDAVRAIAATSDGK